MSPLLLALLAPAQAVHPPVQLLDGEGLPVVRPAGEEEEADFTEEVEGEEVGMVRSQLDQFRTCAQCHDQHYMATHSFHALVHLSEEQPEWAPGLDPDQGQGGQVALECLGCHLEGEPPEDFALEPMAFLQIGRADGEACARCHLPAELGQEPVDLDPDHWSQWARGEVFAWQRISGSDLDLAGKDDLGQPFDVHAERLLECVDCHVTPDVPALSGTEPMPAHMAFGQAPVDVEAYLAQVEAGEHGDVLPLLDATLPRCTDCHDVSIRHQWLPEPEAHQAALACESCHIGERLLPALAEVHRTLPGEPGLRWRGGAPGELTQPWQPVLLEREDGQLSPYNPITTFAWHSEGQTLDPLALQRALRPGGTWVPEVLATLDADDSGEIEGSERLVLAPQAVSAVRTALQAAGHTEPTLVGEITPVGLHHGVGPRSHATRACAACHAREGRLTASLPVVEQLPATATLHLADSAQGSASLVTRGATVTLRPEPARAGVEPPLHPRGRLPLPLALLLLSLATAAGALAWGFRTRRTS